MTEGGEEKRVFAPFPVTDGGENGVTRSWISRHGAVSHAASHFSRPVLLPGSLPCSVTSAIERRCAPMGSGGSGFGRFLSRMLSQRESVFCGVTCGAT